MQPTRREALNYLITSGIILASPKILLSDDNKPKWFHDFNNPYRKPTNMEFHLSEVPAITQNQIDNLEEYVANADNASLNGIVKIRVDEALNPNNKVRFKGLKVYHNGELADLETSGKGIALPKLTNVKHPSVIRIVSPGDDTYIESDIEYRLHGRKNFIQLSLFRRDYNLKAIKEIAFKREYGLENISRPLALFPCNHTDVTFEENGKTVNNLRLPFNKQNIPLELSLILANDYKVDFSREWFEGKFIDEVYPDLSRNRLAIVGGVDWRDRNDVPPWEEIPDFTILGLYNGYNANGTQSEIDPETQTLKRVYFNVHPAAPNDVSHAGSVRGWERMAVQEGASFVMGEPKKIRFSDKYPNSFCFHGPNIDNYDGIHPTDVDIEAGTAMYSQQPGTKMIGTKKLKRRI